MKRKTLTNPYRTEEYYASVQSILIQKGGKTAFLFQCSFPKGINNLLFFQPSNSLLLFKKYILVAKQNTDFFFLVCPLHGCLSFDYEHDNSEVIKKFAKHHRLSLETTRKKAINQSLKYPGNILDYLK